MLVKFSTTELPASVVLLPVYFAFMFYFPLSVLNHDVNSCKRFLEMWKGTFDHHGDIGCELLVRCIYFYTKYYSAPIDHFWGNV